MPLHQFLQPYHSDCEALFAFIQCNFLVKHDLKKEVFPLSRQTNRGAQTDQLGPAARVSVTLHLVSVIILLLLNSSSILTFSNEMAEIHSDQLGPASHVIDSTSP